MSLTVLSVGYPLARVSPTTPGGAEQVLALLDEAVVAAGGRSLVVAPAGSQCHGRLLETLCLGTTFDEQQHSIACEKHRRVIAKAVSDFSIDVIHMHGVDFYHYLPQVSIPTIVTLHLPPSWYPPQVLSSDRLNTYLVCVSQSQRRSCPQDARIHTVIENGVPLEKFESFGKKEDYVAALGRICPEKGFHLALDAATTAGLSLRLAGEVFGYAAHRHYWKTEVEPRLKSPHRFLGALALRQKRELLARARCLLVTSLVDETSCLVAMEALSCGTPVVALRRGALIEIVEHGRTGFLVDTVQELPGAIRSAVELSPDDCRLDAERLFSADRMTARYLSLYRNLTAGSSSISIAPSAESLVQNQ